MNVSAYKWLGKSIPVLLSALLLATGAQAATFIIDRGKEKPILVEGELDADHIDSIEQSDPLLRANPGYFPHFGESGIELIPLSDSSPAKADAQCASGFPSNPYDHPDGHCVTQMFRQSCHEYQYVFIWVRAGSYYRLQSWTMLRYCD